MPSLTIKNYFRFLAFMLVITTYLNVVTYNLPPIIRSHHLWTPIWLASIVFIYPKVLQNRLFLYVLVYEAIRLLVFGNFVWVYKDDWTNKLILGEFYVYVIAFSIYAYFKTSQDFKGLAILVKWTAIFIGITAILTIYSSIIDPMYARKITSGSFEDLGDLMKFGGGTYGYASVLVCIFPIMIYYYRNNTACVFSKKKILIFGVLCFVALIRMQIFANIILSAFIIIFALAGSKYITRSIYISVFLVSIILIIPKETYANVLISLSGNFQKNTEIYYKLNDLSNYILYSDIKSTSAAERVDRYPMLWEAFKDSPFLGHYSKPIYSDIGEGAHLSWMYRLSSFGVFDFIFYVILYYRFIVITVREMDEKIRFYYLLSVLSIILLGLLKTLGGRETGYVYFVFLYGSYYLPLLKKYKSSVYKT